MNPAYLSKSKTRKEKNQPPPKKKTPKTQNPNQTRTNTRYRDSNWLREEKKALPPPNAFLSNTPELALEVITSLSLEMLQF